MRYKSNLFIPGHTLDRLDRGLNSNASALIIDLEDGCPDDKKIEAREELIGLLKKKDGGQSVWELVGRKKGMFSQNHYLSG